MRICDVCLLPGSNLTSVAATTAGKYLWPTVENRPDFCDECLGLLIEKSWSGLGERHGKALQRFLERENE